MDHVRNHLGVIPDSLPMRIAASLLAAALAVVAILVGVSGAVGAPAPRHSAGYSSAATSRDSAVHRRRFGDAKAGEEIWRTTCAACHALMDPVGLGLENLRGVPRPRRGRRPAEHGGICSAASRIQRLRCHHC